MCSNLSARGSRWATRAAELAAWLKKRPFCGCPAAENVTGESYEATIKGRTGIIYYRDYWLREGEKQPTGDHIDLWNGSRLTASGLEGTITALLRFTVGVQSAHVLGLGFSDLRKAKEILFWPIP